MGTNNDEGAPEHKENAPADDQQDHVETMVLSEEDAELPADEALAAARAEAEENWNKYVRAAAELENVRKRSAREVEKARNYGVEGLASA